MKDFFVCGLLVLAGGANASSLYSNGPVVDGNGLSVLSLPATTLGYGAQNSAANSVADDFTVTGSTWNIESLVFFAYQTGATNFTFQTATWSIHANDVAGYVVVAGSDAVSSGGRVGYRVTSTTLSDTQRGIYGAYADIPDLALSAGHYWLTWSLTGSLASGPWQPPTSDARTGNAMQSAAGGPFLPLEEAGTGLGVELPFEIIGTATVTAVPEPSTLVLMLVGGFAVATRVRRNW